MVERNKFAQFLDHVQIQAGGCWTWTGSGKGNGYGHVRRGAKNITAHRMSYMLFVGDIPPKSDVCHRCDNRACVNPDHLFVGSRLENMRDAVNKGRQAKGQRLPGAKLDEAKVIEIRARLKQGDKPKDIAASFGVWSHTIRNIKRGITWNHVKES